MSTLPQESLAALAERIKSRAARDGECLVIGNPSSQQQYWRVCGPGRTTLLAHRVVWSAKNGEIPDGMCVCHKCDNTRCVNEDHMFLGTVADNMADKIAKGRDAKIRKLTTDQVSWLRKHFEHYVRGDAARLANRLGVSVNTIFMVRRNQTWRHV